jgi:hypothetical protein
MTVAALYLDLSSEEWQMEAQSTRAQDTSPTAAWRTTSDKAASGSMSRKSVWMKNIDWVQMGLPSALWKDLGNRSWGFFLQRKDALIKNGGNFSQLYSMSPPLDHVVEAFNKNAKCKRANQDDDGKDKKKSKCSKAHHNKA